MEKHRKKKIKKDVYQILLEKGVDGVAISNVLNSIVNYVYKEEINALTAITKNKMESVTYN